MTRRWGLGAVLVAAGVLVAVGGPLVWHATRPPGTTGRVGTVGAGVAEALAEAPPATGPTVPGPPVATQDGRLRAVGADQAPIPVELRLPTLGVVSPVRPVGVERDGELEIPEDVRTVGWYRYGPRPGDARGSAVLSGHVDSAVQGRGAFFRLGELTPGDPVLVRLSDRQVRRYRVVARQEWPSRRGAAG